MRSFTNYPLSFHQILSHSHYHSLHFTFISSEVIQYTERGLLSSSVDIDIIGGSCKVDLKNSRETGNNFFYNPKTKSPGFCNQLWFYHFSAETRTL